jgi:hypothetical protein
MTVRSPRAVAIWRGLALVFAVSVVAVRLGMAGCATTAPPPAGAGAAGAPAPVAAAPPAPRVRDPAFFAPTKAGGGYYPVNIPSASAQQGAPPAARQVP